MFAEELPRDQWIDRFTMRLGVLLPGMDPTEASLRAEQIAHDAYAMRPEDAAEVYLELPDLPVDALSDYEKYQFATWTLAYVFDDGSRASASALQAAAAVFESEGAKPVAGMLAQFKLECWDDAGFTKDMELSEEEHKAQRTWVRASLAADAEEPIAPGHPKGRLAMQWPSKVRWEAARERWLQRQRDKA
jgi:hypothetical protein